MLQFSLLLELAMSQPLQLLLPFRELFQIRSIFLRQHSKFLFSHLKLIAQLIVFEPELIAFSALPLTQNLVCFEIGLLEVFTLIGLKPSQGVDVALDLCDHKVEFLDMFDGSVVLPPRAPLPNVPQQLEMLNLLADHLLLLVSLLLLLEPDERQLPVKVVFLFKEPVQLPQQQFLAEGSGLELAYFVQLVAEIWPLLCDFLIFFAVLPQQLGYIFLQFSQLRVVEVAVGVEDGAFGVVGALTSLDLLVIHDM